VSAFSPLPSAPPRGGGAPPAPIPSFSHPTTTERLIALLADHDFAGARVLDLGAGAGYFSWKLAEALDARGLDPAAIITPCDLHPHLFMYDRLECVPADFSAGLPFADGTFDVVVCMEVIEHIPDQMALWREIARVTKGGGRALVTTPNVLSLNARLRYLLTGTMPLYDVLPIEDADVVHTTGHVNPVSLYYLFYFARRAGFDSVGFHIDRVKRSALLFFLPFYALAKAATAVLDLRRRRLPWWEENRAAAAAVNSWRAFVGRTIIADARRAP
jgi:SAM-dependent methyltransferase